MMRRRNIYIQIYVQIYIQNTNIQIYGYKYTNLPGYSDNLLSKGRIQARRALGTLGSSGRRLQKLSRLLTVTRVERENIKSKTK